MAQTHLSILCSDIQFFLTIYDYTKNAIFVEHCLSIFIFQILDIVEVTRVSSIDLLRSLNLRGNALRELPDYRLSVIFAVHQLTQLDTEHIDIAEKVCLAAFD